MRKPYIYRMQSKIKNIYTKQFKKLFPQAHNFPHIYIFHLFKALFYLLYLIG